jgi:DNA-directed RNA polymerase specialized sigma24 family protein
MKEDNPKNTFVQAGQVIVLALLIKLVRDRHAAEDIAQEVIVAALASPNFDPCRPDAIGFMARAASWRAA